MSRVAALQLHTLAMSDSRIDHYLNLAAKDGASVVVLGEYVINSFFNEIVKMPKSMIKEQSEHKKTSLSAMANRYNLTIIAPLLQIKGKGLGGSITGRQRKNRRYGFRKSQNRENHSQRGQLMVGLSEGS